MSLEKQNNIQSIFTAQLLGSTPESDLGPVQTGPKDTPDYFDKESGISLT